MLTIEKKKLAIDLNLILCYGILCEEELHYIIRSQAKAGTCSFYASVYIISRGKRMTSALHAVRREKHWSASSHLVAYLH